MSLTKARNLCSVAGLAKILGINRSTLDHYVYRAKIIPAPTVKPCGRRAYYTAEEVEEIKKQVAAWKSET